MEFKIGFEYLSFLDTNSSYHKTLMYLYDEQKIMLKIDRGTFCYQAMPFDAKLYLYC